MVLSKRDIPICKLLIADTKIKQLQKFKYLGSALTSVSDCTKEVCAFIVDDNLYQYKVMPFGMKNSSAAFQKMMGFLFNDLRDCEVYIDDLIIYNATWEEHLKIIK